jgi:hypothetical protein
LHFTGAAADVDQDWCGFPDRDLKGRAGIGTAQETLAPLPWRLMTLAYRNFILGRFKQKVQQYNKGLFGLDDFYGPGSTWAREIGGKLVPQAPPRQRTPSAVATGNGGSGANGEPGFSRIVPGQRSMIRHVSAARFRGRLAPAPTIAIAIRRCFAAFACSRNIALNPNCLAEPNCLDCPVFRDSEFQNGGWCRTRRAQYR